MEIFLITMHVLAAFVLVAVVLLQHGKGADIGATFGAGASQTVFGSRGAGNFLSKLTTAFVVVFMITSISLTYFSNPSGVPGLLEGQTGGAPVTTQPEVEELPAGEPIPGAQPIEGSVAPGAAAVEEIAPPVTPEPSAAPATETAPPPVDAAPAPATPEAPAPGGS